MPQQPNIICPQCEKGFYVTPKHKGNIACFNCGSIFERSESVLGKRKI